MFLRLRRRYVFSSATLHKSLPPEPNGYRATRKPRTTGSLVLPPDLGFHEASQSGFSRGGVHRPSPRLTSFKTTSSARQIKSPANMVESPNRRPYPPSTIFKYPTTHIPTTSLTSHRRGLLALEWKGRFTGVSTCTSTPNTFLIICALYTIQTYRCESLTI